MRLIDADAFLKRNEVYADCEFIHPMYQNTLREIVDDEPTIDAVQVRHGEWIGDRLVTTNGGTYGVRRCSRCEAYYQDIGYGWDYCPNCGARMDGGEHDLR